MGVHAVIGEIFCNDIVDNDIVMIEKNDSRLFVSSVKFLFRRFFPNSGPIVDAVFIPDGFPLLQILRLCLEMDGNHPAISIEEPWAQGPRLHMVRIEPQVIFNMLPVVGGDFFPAGKDGAVGFNCYRCGWRATTLEDHGFVEDATRSHDQCIARRQFGHGVANSLERLV